MPRGRGDPPDLAIAEQDGIAVTRQCLRSAIEVEQHESSGWSTQIVHARDRLLPAVAALGQVHRRADPADLVRERAVIGLVSEARCGSRDAQCLERPGARGLISQRGKEFCARHDHLATHEHAGSMVDVLRRIATAITPGIGRANSRHVSRDEPRDAIGVGLAHGLPHDGPVRAHVGHLDAQHEAHGVEVGDERRGIAGLDRDPRGGPVISQVHLVLDVAVRAEDECGGRGARGQGLEMLSGEAVQPRESIGSTDGDDSAMRQIDGP